MAQHWMRNLGFLVFVISIIGVVMAWYYSCEPAHAEAHARSFEACFEREHQSVAEALRQAETLQDVAAIGAESPWAIDLYVGDSLVYWNSDQRSSDFAYQDTFALGKNRWAIIRRFESVGEGHYKDESLSPVAVFALGSELDNAVDIGGVLQSASIPAEHHLFSQRVGFLGYVMAFVLLLFFALKKSLQYSKWVSYAALLAISLVALLIPLESWTPDLIFSKTRAEMLGLQISILDLVLVSMATLGLAYLFGRRQTMQNYRPASIMLLGLLTSVYLLGILKLAKEVASHPAIQLEIDRIFKFDKYSIIVMICLACMCLSHLLVSIYCMYDAKVASVNGGKRVLPYYLVGVAASIAVYFALNLSTPFVILYVYMLSLYTMIDLFIDTTKKNITWLIWWIMILSGFLSIAIFHIGLSKSRQQRADFVAHFFDFGEQGIDANIGAIDQALRSSDLFDRIASPPIFGMRFDRDDLTDYVSDYLTEKGLMHGVQHIELEGFNTFGNSIFSNHFAFESQFRQHLLRSKAINDFVYYHPIDREYIINYELIGDRENESTNFFIIIERTATQEETSEELDFNYVLYKQATPIHSHIADDHVIDPTQLYQAQTAGSGVKGYDTDMAADDGLTIIAYRKISSLIKPISLFSYLFTLFGIMVFIMTLINSRLHLFRTPIYLHLSNRSSLRNKIQLGVIFLVLFAFIVIGLLTAYYFNNVIQNTNRKTINEQSLAIYNNIESTVQPSLDANSAITIVTNKLDEIATIHSKPLAIYSLRGQLLHSSEANRFADRMPYATWHMMSQSPRQGTTSANLSLSYLPIYHNGSQPYAYLSLAHNDNIKTSKNLLDFLSTILNVYVFLFLLAGSIAIIIANSITRPLTVLGEKLKAFKLGKRNEPLEWKSKDEIGALIQDYNNLIVDLEKSADIIAMTERDTAWREMAKQVAHEIKNPLTPMKLSIQYLQRAIQSDGDNQALIKRVSSTLIEQIDNLTQIANEFSNFASMPMASNEKLLLNDIVEMIHELFRKREDMDIKLVEPITDLYVYADKNHLIRILNNILKNAIQAIPEDRRGKIVISLYREGQSAIVQVEDNGTGIPDDQKDKVFTPKFTTKSSGTGLGLAISANMIDAFNGKIYFETEYGVGTSFFVEIPLMRLQDHNDGITRVVLD